MPQIKEKHFLTFELGAATNVEATGRFGGNGRRHRQRTPEDTYTESKSDDAITVDFAERQSSM